MTTLGESFPLPAPQPLSGARSSAWWGMLALIGTEATLFVILLFSYFYLRWDAPRWPPEGTPLPSLRIIIPATVLLLGSSAPMTWAEWGIGRGRQTTLKLGLLLAWLMAASFMTMELYEWSQLPFGPGNNEYTSLFFTITGLHMAHVTIALAMNAYVQLRAWLGHFDARRHLAIQNVGLYWHFVDVVWIFVLSTVYLSPHLR